MRYVIVPNSLPEIFTGARVAMGVFGAQLWPPNSLPRKKGHYFGHYHDDHGALEGPRFKFQQTDIVVLNGIILIGIIGFGIDILMRWAERVLVPC